MRRGLRKHIFVVMLASFLLFCGCASAHDKDAKAQVSSAIPDALIGVWHRNDQEGREACEAYKKIESENDITEETAGLVGGLMITRHLVHAYSDYGEGDFYVIKRVVELGNQNWEVDALIGTDSMPSEGADGFKGTFRFHVSAGLLSMEDAVAAEGSSYEAKFFKCGKVLDGMYSEQGGTSSSQLDDSGSTIARDEKLAKKEAIMRVLPIRSIGSRAAHVVIVGMGRPQADRSFGRLGKLSLQ